VVYSLTAEVFSLGNWGATFSDPDLSLPLRLTMTRRPGRVRIPRPIPVKEIGIQVTTLRGIEARLAYGKQTATDEVANEPSKRHYRGAGKTNAGVSTCK